MSTNHLSPVSHHVVSLTVPTKTAPVGSNPFEDDEDEEEEEEEEMAVEQQTTVNHISVNKEEIKTLVNRRETLRPIHPPTASTPLAFFCFCLGSSSFAVSSSPLLLLLPPLPSS